MFARSLSLSFGLGATIFLGLVANLSAEDRGSWFKSLKQPGTGMSCCDVADCRRTDADWHDGQWWAVVQGQWTPVPQEKELRDKTSIDGDAYVCSSPDPARTIYCFVPPDMAM